MPRKLIAIVTLALSGALLIPSGAVPLGDADRASGDLVLSPHEGPNGGYAIVNADDELELLLTDANPNVEGEGVAPGSIMPLARVFKISNTGERATTVWITDESDDVRFFRGDDPSDSLERRADAVALGPSEAVSVGLEVDTTDPNHGVADVESFTVHAIRDEATESTPEPTESCTDVEPTPTPSPEPTAVNETPVSTQQTPSSSEMRSTTVASTEPPQSTSTEASSAGREMAEPTRATPSTTSAGATDPGNANGTETTTAAGGLGLILILFAFLATIACRYADIGGWE